MFQTVVAGFSNVPPKFKSMFFGLYSNLEEFTIVNVYI
jgi:hypothetical protein